MATYNLTKKQNNISSGQRFVSNNSDNTVKLEERVVILESKIDKILSLLENKKDD
tara:strand:+ start:647 stop:811 length:165 start_codon:yes stop_codon:yes gene_type:complete